MRRYEQQSPQRQAASSFRVLSPGRQQLQYEVQVALNRNNPTITSPPSTRAPEPYKLVTPARTQRKSAFAIIAEPPPPGSRANSRPASPTGFPASGRVSPFRGRGFKGPPPRSRSRPHTPPRGNNSAHSSPRRSLSQIPRPSNLSNNKVAPLSRSKDDLSTTIRKPSPKFGRRAAPAIPTTTMTNNNNNNNRYTSSVGSNNQQSRNAQNKSIINKRPSATNTTTTVPNGKLKQKAPGSGQEINNKLLRVPAKNVPSGKRFVTANNNRNNNNNNNVNRINVTSRGGSKQQQQSNGTNDNSPESPSKIPLRNGASSLSASREVLNKLPAKITTNAKDDKETANKMGKSSTTASTTNKESSNPTTTTNEDQDLGLVDLLKQSSGAMGTQSVVNTTTTTAVQPLQIDAASILAEAELVAKLSNLEKKQKEMEAARNSEQQSTSDQTTTTTTTAAVTTNTKKEQSLGKDQIDEKSKNGPYTQTMIKHFGPNSSNANGDDKKSTTISSNAQVEVQKQAVTANEKQSKEPESSTTISQNKDDDTKSKPNSSKRNSPRSSANEKKLTTLNNRTKKSNNIMETSLTQAGSSESLGSIRSTDTGVSLNTVRGVSSAKEKTGIHMVKKAEEIETLSGNIATGSNGERALGADDNNKANNSSGPTGTTAGAAATKWSNFKNRLVKRLGCAAKRPHAANNCWPKMRCLACRRDPKAQLWPGKKARGASTIQLTAPASGERSAKTRWQKIKDACRCVELRERRRRRRLQRLQVAPLDTPNPTMTTTTTTTPPAIVTARKCCPINITALCRGLFSKCTCCGRRRQSLQSEHSSKRSKSVRAKHSLTSVTGPTPSENKSPKLPDTLVETHSVMQGAIPCLPIPVAWFCLVFNVLIPGTGTIFSGLFNLCMGQPRFALQATPAARFGALVVNFVVGISQLFTVLFCLVGWGWSIWWGVIMVRVARKWKRFKESEATANDPEAHATLPAPGIASLASLRPAAGTNTTAERPR